MSASVFRNQRGLTRTGKPFALTSEPVRRLEEPQDQLERILTDVIVLMIKKESRRCVARG